MTCPPGSHIRYFLFEEKIYSGLLDYFYIINCIEFVDGKTCFVLKHGQRILLTLFVQIHEADEITNMVPGM